MKLPTISTQSLDHIAIGAMARQQRERSGFSLREVARRLDLSAAYVSNLERGRNNWTEKRFADFRRALK
jgi:transcriptional regulator with XRE-family HTH domain